MKIPQDSRGHMDTLTVPCMTQRVLGLGRRDSDRGAQRMMRGGRKSKRWQWGWAWGWAWARPALGQIQVRFLLHRCPSRHKACHRADPCSWPATPKGAAVLGAQEGPFLTATAHLGPTKPNRMGTEHAPTWGCSQGWHWQPVRPRGTSHSWGGCAVTPSSYQGSGGVGANDAEASGGLAASTVLLKK